MRSPPCRLYPQRPRPEILPGPRRVAAVPPSSLACVTVTRSSGPATDTTLSPAAVQAAEDAQSIFLRDHGPYWQVLTADWSALGKWYMPSMLTWWYAPPGEACTTQWNWEKMFTCYESIASIPEAAANSRFTLTPWYFTAQVVDIEPVEMTSHRLGQRSGVFELCLAAWCRPGPLRPGSVGNHCCLLHFV